MADHDSVEERSAWRCGVRRGAPGPDGGLARVVPAGRRLSAWFLNSGRAVVLTAVLLFIAGAFVGLTTKGAARESLVASGNLAAGAIVAMCVVLALTGPGTLFPIALTIGAGVAVISSAAGALAGSAIRRR
jgi:phosphate/sulfate permease